jgi:enterochelin esterase-like enzyme
MWNLIVKLLGKKIKRQSNLVFLSKNLGREVLYDLYLPPKYSENTRQLSLAILNDGQDLERMNFLQILQRLYFFRQLPPIIAVGIHAGDRMQEYGTAHQADYANRGAKAKAYNDFLIEEFLPFLEKKYRINANPSQRAIAGFSLGGLSSFDLGWNNSDVFGKIGVFSGALWWRSAPFKEATPDADRIIHTMVADSKGRKKLKFWLQTGTNDETDDRNNNGIIDSIDDTMDLIIELKLKGYSDKVIEYVEVEAGEHNPDTWGEVMPQFLKWAFK